MFVGAMTAAHPMRSQRQSRAIRILGPGWILFLFAWLYWSELHLRVNKDVKIQQTIFLLASVFGSAQILSGCSSGGHEEAHKAAKSPVTVQAKTVVVQAGLAEVTHTVTGVVESKLNSVLSGKVMGRVNAVLVREGDRVKKGQLLISIDARELSAAAASANANLNASRVGVGSAKTAVAIEEKTSRARIEQAEAQLQQAKAQLAAANANLDLVKAGPRTQEVEQSRIAVTQAESNLRFAKTELDRTRALVEEGALARRELDVAQNRYDLAKGQYDAAVQNESIAREGARTQQIRAATEAVTQAKAGVQQAEGSVKQARAAALQVQLRRKDVEVANAQVQQAAAAANASQVSLSYSKIYAPFDGVVVDRMVDPGTMASPGMPLVAVQGGGLFFTADVPESLLSSLTAGTTARLRIGKEGTVTEGEVVEVVPQGDASTHSFTVKFSLEETPEISPGQFGRAEIRTGKREGLTIPAAATWQRDGLHYAFVVDKESIARLRIITVSEPEGDTVTVLSGLKPGERIVASNPAAVSDGAKVEAL